MQHITKDVIIGIDVSKDKLDIWILPENKHLVISNNRRSIGQWIKSILKHHSIDKVLFEPTGGYEKALITGLLSHHINPTLVHPNRLYHFAKSLGTQAKTDKIDCKNMALFAQRNPDMPMLKSNYIENKRLAELSSRRRQLKDMIHAESCRVSHEFLQKGISASHKRLLKALEKELKHLNELIEKVINDDECKRAQYGIMTSMKGIGVVSAQTLIVDLPELGTLTRSQIAKLVGVAPLNRESGKWQGERHIYGGRGHVRKVLYMSALVAIRFDPRMKALHEKLMNKGKAFKVALVAVIRRMLCTLNVMIRDMRAYQPLTD